MDIKTLAKEAGFRVFGEKIVAADQGSSGLATESLERFATLVAERTKQECWDEINKWIKLGELQGNGCDDTAQRNGMILASNLISGLMGANVKIQRRSQSVRCNAGLARITETGE